MLYIIFCFLESSSQVLEIEMCLQENKSTKLLIKKIIPIRTTSRTWKVLTSGLFGSCLKKQNKTQICLGYSQKDQYPYYLKFDIRLIKTTFKTHCIISKYYIKCYCLFIVTYLSYLHLSGCKCTNRNNFLYE